MVRLELPPSSNKPLPGDSPIGCSLVGSLLVCGQEPVMRAR